MISPRGLRNEQEGAHLVAVKKLSIARCATCAKVVDMEPRPGAAGSCNSVFRYPSPFGWFCGVPAESPVFSSGYLGHRQCQTAKEPVTRAGRARGQDRCGFTKSYWQEQRRLALRPAATRLANRRLSALARAPRPQPWLAATLQRVPSLAAQPTPFIVRNSPTSAERACATRIDLIFSAASQSIPTPRPSTCISAAVAFLLPTSAAASAVQDQEGH